MKKVFLAAMMSLSLGLIATAQSTKTANANASKFSLGPVAGFGWTTISNVDNSKFKAAGSFGLASVYSAFEHFGIGLDVKYSFEGAKSETIGIKNETSLDYVRIPLKAIYFFNGYGDRMRPKIYAGPSFGFLSSAKINDVDQKSSFENFDIGILAGLGLNYRLVNRTWFNVDASYTNGLKEIYKYSIGTDKKYVNRNIQLNIGVNFGL